MRIILNIGMGSGGAGRELLPHLARLAVPVPVLALAAAAGLAAPAALRADEPQAPVTMAIERELEVAREAVEHGKAFTGDATPVEPGHVEVEVAYAPSWWATAGAVDRAAGDQHLVAAAVGVGLARDLDARVVLGWSTVHATPASPGAPAAGTGLADTTVAARWRFLSLAEPGIDLAVSVAVTAPTGTHTTQDQLGTSAEAWSVGGALLASADWGRLTAGAELGLSAPLATRGSNDVMLLVCNAAVGYQLLPWLQPEVELNYQHEVETGPEADERVLWGTAALVLPVDSVRVLVGARFPLWASNAAVGPMATAAVKFAF